MAPRSYHSHNQTISEIIACYLRYCKKKRIFSRGEKPGFFLKNKVITEREWRSYLYKSGLKNQILDGYRYHDYLESTSETTYKNVADHFRVSKARVSQMIAFVTKLPEKILNFLESESNPDKLKYFTERRLRPLTLLKSDEEKIERFEEMKYDVS